MTQNNLINQIVEVMTKHSKPSFEAGEGSVIYQQSFQAAATEIASLHPLTKLREEVERLRDEAQLEKYKSETTLAKVLRDGKISAFNQVLSLLSQENDGWISVEDRLPETEDNVLAVMDGERCVMSYGTAVNKSGEECKAWFYVYDGLNGDAYHDDDYNPTHWQPLPSPPKSK